MFNKLIHNKIFIFVFLVLFIFGIFIKPKVKVLKNPDIYLINLDKSINRLEKATKQFKDSNLKFNRLSATYGKDVLITDEDNNVSKGEKYLSEKLFEKNKTYKIECSKDLTVDYRNEEVLNNGYFGFFKKIIKESKRSLKIGEIGCGCSHFRFLKEIIDKDLPYALVFEDDFNVINKKTFKEDLNKVLSNVPKDCELVYLIHSHLLNKGFVYYRNKVLSKLIYGNYKYFDYFLPSTKGGAVTASYLITNLGAKKILDDIKQNGMQNLPIDLLYNNVYIKSKKIKACFLTLNLLNLSEESNISDINNISSR